MITDVTIRCKACESRYRIPIEELKEKAGETHGFYPCRKCGSWATVWLFGETKEIDESATHG